MTYTTQAQVRAAFWEAHPNASREMVKGFERCYVCDTRCAFVDFVDHLARDGHISEALASRVTL
jgi:hypothetical protein